MANLKDIKRRIGSVKNTQQITRAMKLVAAAKLRRAQEAVTKARPFADKVYQVMESLSLRVDPDAHPLLKQRAEVKKILILVMSGDKGLCGPFNSNVFKESLKLIDENKEQEISLVIVGKKGLDFFKRRPYTIEKTLFDYGKNLSINYARDVAEVLKTQFLEEKADRVVMVYNKFKNVVVQEPTRVQLIPASLPYQEEEERPVDYEYEPSAEDVLDGMLTQYIENQIYQALLESSASENGSRMTAMDAATKNAKEMINGLTLEYNRARQAAITTELIEVVAGADALGG